MCERRILARGTRAAASSSSGTHSGVNFIHMRSRAARVISGRSRRQRVTRSAPRLPGRSQIWLGRRGPAPVSAARAERDDGHSRLCSDSGRARPPSSWKTRRKSERAAVPVYLRAAKAHDATVCGQKG